MATKRNWREVTVEGGTIWDKSNDIEGTLVKAQHDVGPNSSNLYTLKTDDGDTSVWGSTVLDDKLMGLPVGSYVRIEYEGLLKSKKGTEYHGYKVFFDENETSGNDSGYAKARATAAKIKSAAEGEGEEDLSEIFPED